MCLIIFLSQIARPDAVTEGATNLGVLGAGKNLGVAGLAGVVPALGGGVADAGAETWERGHFAKPAADEDGLEVAGVAWSHDLSHGAGVELVLESAAGRVGCVLGVGLELAVLGQGRQTHLGAPLLDDTHVAAGRGTAVGGGSRGRGRVIGRIVGGVVRRSSGLSLRLSLRLGLSFWLSSGSGSRSSGLSVGVLALTPSP